MKSEAEQGEMKGGFGCLRLLFANNCFCVTLINPAILVWSREIPINFNFPGIHEIET